MVPILAALRPHPRRHNEFLRALGVHHGVLDWIAATEATAPAPLQSFARHLRQDLNSVIVGLTLPWNSGPVEGHVNRVKMLKRQCYGRAGLRLLRRRILLTP